MADCQQLWAWVAWPCRCLELPGKAQEAGHAAFSLFFLINLCPVRTHSKHMLTFVKMAFACIQHFAVQSRKVTTRRQDSTITKKKKKKIRTSHHYVQEQALRIT